MLPVGFISAACGELRGTETRVDLAHADIALDNGETYSPFFDGELHPVIDTANPAIGVGHGSEGERGLDTLADCEPRMSLDPNRLLRG